MNESFNPAASPAPAHKPPRKRSPFLPGLIALACTFLLTGGAFFGFISTCGNFPNSGPRQPANSIFVGMMLIAFALFLLSLLWLFVLFVWRMFRRGEGDQ